MKTLSVTEMARNFRVVLNNVEFEQVEIALLRNNRLIARIIPESPHQNALEVFGDLYRKLDDAAADALVLNIVKQRKSRKGRLDELRNPWAS